MVVGKKETCGMNIVIDGRMINESGIGRYLRNLISELQKLDRKNEYYLLLMRKNYDTSMYQSNFKKVLADSKWYTLEEQIRLPRILGQIDADLVHFPHFNVPYFYDGKFVVTIHDLIHQSFSMERSTHTPLIYGLKHLGYKKIFGNALKKSEKILVPSNYVKSQLIKKWDIDDEKIVVTYEGVDDKMLTAVSKMSTDKNRKILEKFHVRSPYIFYVGNAHPHKNVEGLVKAFTQIHLPGGVENLSSSHLGGGKPQLVLAGQDNFFWRKIKSSAISYQSSDIVYTGYVNDEELVALYKNASCFVMPSFEEGFGLPILEAFALGCPVVSSNAASLPEVGGDAVIYFDPHDLADMGDKIIKVLKSEELRQDLIKKGKERVKRFSWKKMAEKTLEVYQQCV